MVTKESELPATIQLWRSLMQWLGGMGLALLLTSIIKLEVVDREVSTAECALPKGAQRFNTVRTLCLIYAGLTLAGVLSFWLLDMGLWGSINHTMTSVSTDGFTVTDDSFAGYAMLIKITVMMPALSGAVSFGVYRDVMLKLQMQALFSNSPKRALLLTSLIAMVVL